MTPFTPEETQGGKRMDIHTIEIHDWIRWLHSLSAFFFYGLSCFFFCQKKLHVSTWHFSEHLFILYLIHVLLFDHLPSSFLLFPIISNIFYTLNLFLGCCYNLSDLFFSLITLDFNLYFREVSAFLCTQFSLGLVLFSSSFIHHI